MLRYKPSVKYLELARTSEDDMSALEVIEYLKRHHLDIKDVLEILEIFSFTASDSLYVKAVNLSDSGNLGVGLEDGCYYVLNSEGSLLRKVCALDDVFDADYCCGKFAFVTKGGYLYVFREDETAVLIMEIDEDVTGAVTLLRDGVILCRHRCDYIDFEGDRIRYFVVTDVLNSPAVQGDYVYIPDWGGKALRIFKLNDVESSMGLQLNVIHYDEKVWDVAVCDNYLALVSVDHLYLYDISDPMNIKEVWRNEEINYVARIAFSPNCRYLAVADKKLSIFDLRSYRKVLEKDYGERIAAIDWRKGRIAVGTLMGEVYVYGLDANEVLPYLVHMLPNTKTMIL